MAPGFGHDVLGDRAIVVWRRGIGHTGDGGKATGGGSQRARAHGLLVLLPRLPQVDVHVDQTGSHHQSRSIDDLGVLGARNLLVHPGDPPVLDQHLEQTIEILAGIHYPAAGDEKSHSSSL